MISMQFVQVRHKTGQFQVGVGDMAKISYQFFRHFTILSQFFCHVSFTSLSEQYCQTNFPIIKTKPFKETKYK